VQRFFQQLGIETADGRVGAERRDDGFELIHPRHQPVDLRGHPFPRVQKGLHPMHLLPRRFSPSRRRIAKV